MTATPTTADRRDRLRPLTARSSIPLPHGLTTQLREIETCIANDLAAIPRGASLERLAAHHQLDLRGKLLRPMLVAMAARLGRGFGTEARLAAVAVELIHNATLLHDDVIDVAERRRGGPAARTVHGNAASVLGGDWLLVEALKRIRRCGHADLLDYTLDTLERMVGAEALQLQRRGRVDLGREEYFRIVDGKTAALFRCAMFAGATVGGLGTEQRSMLERYGEHLGVAFQLVDDLLDMSGDPAVTGKAALSDLRQGKMTYPLLLAMERDRSLRTLVEGILGSDGEAPSPEPLRARLRRSLIATGSLGDCRELARSLAQKAIACLVPIPGGPDRTALASLALFAAERER